LVIGYAVYLYHRLPISYRDVQELLFKRGIDVSHETVRAWCVKFGPDTDLPWKLSRRELTINALQRRAT
jgi:putative transposase